MTIYVFQRVSGCFGESHILSKQTQAYRNDIRLLRTNLSINKNRFKQLFYSYPHDLFPGISPKFPYRTSLIQIKGWKDTLESYYTGSFLSKLG